MSIFQYFPVFVLYFPSLTIVPAIVCPSNSSFLVNPNRSKLVVLTVVISTTIVTIHIHATEASLELIASNMLVIILPIVRILGKVVDETSNRGLFVKYNRHNGKRRRSVGGCMRASLSVSVTLERL